MFRAPGDYVTYLGQLAEACTRMGVRLHAYVLMTNHVHLLLTPGDTRGTSRTMQRLGTRYVRYFNVRYGRTGTLWEGRFHSSVVDHEHYLLTCYRYIELNPVRASIVTHPGEYAWSSFRCNAYGMPDSLVTPHDRYRALGATSAMRCSGYAELFASALVDGEVRALRWALQRGRSISDTLAADCYVL